MHAQPALYILCIKIILAILSGFYGLSLPIPWNRKGKMHPYASRADIVTLDLFCKDHKFSRTVFMNLAFSVSARDKLLPHDSIFTMALIRREDLHFHN